MSLLEKLIHGLAEQNAHTPFEQNALWEIKNSIKVLLNAKLDDCFSVNDLGMPDLIEQNLSSSELCASMAREIQKLISKYEQRIQISSMSYDNSLSPWKLSFFLQCFFCNDAFKEFGIEIIFKNNRYCEVV